MTAEPIAVIGAGIAGLTCALSLSQAGFHVDIFERTSELKPVGAGIQLSPNALRVLARLGLIEAVAARSVSAESVTLRAARSGRVLAIVPVSAADGTGYLAIHRAHLQEVLLAAVERDPHLRLHLGLELEDARSEDDRVSIMFRDRQSGEAQSRSSWLLVGADGVSSRLAAALKLPRPRDTGLVAARYSVPGNAIALEGIEAWLGPRRHAVAYPIRGGEETNLVLIGKSAGNGDAMARTFSRWDARLNELIGGSTFQGVWPLLQSEPRRGLVHGRRICLIGDAAHAMLPFAAQGAAMAIEDGFVLARELAAEGEVHTPEEALRRFEHARMPRIEKVRRRVGFHRFVYHLPFPFAAGRNAVLAHRQRASLRADLAWLYDWAP